MVEHAFGRIKIILGHPVTVLDEPFVSKAAENYFISKDPYFKEETQPFMRSLPSAPDQGRLFEPFMMSAFVETFNLRPLSDWMHTPTITDMCQALGGKVEIVGWREPGLEQGTTRKNISMDEFMDAHLHQKSSSFSKQDWSDTLSTVSAKKITNHAKDFQQYCPDNIYISMIVAYPTKWTSKLPSSSAPIFDASGVQQVVINVGDNNFGEIFPKEHVEFIDRLKNAGKRSVADDDDDGGDRTKKQRA
ncbi:hypothetical protein BGX29_001963 [Mortierella sp. GBA35]|nr:hypothetical protein BGX29_001963 [Mortierella sp. GBA35]